MSKLDDILIDAINNGGMNCTCKNCSKDKAVEYIDKNGKLLFYLNKECPIHGIGRLIYPQQQGRA